MDNFHSDYLIQIIAFLNAVDSSRLAASSKRFYFLTHQFRILSGPELVAAKGNDMKTAADKEGRRECLLQNCLKRLKGPPTLCLAFHSEEGDHPHVDEMHMKKLPSNAICIGAVSTSIQANVNKEVDSSMSDAILLGRLPQAQTHIEPFGIDMEDDDTQTLFEDELSKLKSRLQENRLGIKAIIVYVCGSGSMHAEKFISEMQQMFPAASVVGGICAISYVWKGTQQICLTVNGIVGVAFSGSVPVRSVVSRGVKSLTAEPGQTTTQWVVHETRLLRPGDDEYIFTGPSEHLRPYHEIRLVRNTETGRIVSPMYFFSRLPAQFVGLKRPGEDGFELNQMNSFSVRTNRIIVLTDNMEEQEASYENASLDFFELDGAACMEDMDRTLTKLKQQTENEVILGGIMFSCAGRGPQPGLLPEQMADAQKFHKHFPNVPCLGFYAGGEIGPAARPGRSQDIFRSGSAALQGFTCVFALFIVPVVEPGTFNIDDRDENVTAFVTTSLAQTSSE